MKLKKLSFQIVCLVLFVICFSGLILADQPQARFKYKTDNYIDFQEKDYIPIEEVARALDYDLNWRLNKDQVRGTIDNKNWYSNNFIIYQGRLFLTKDFYKNNLDLKIKIRGNWYYIYPVSKITSNLEIKIKTNKTSYEKNEPIAVSILLFNKSDDLISLKYTSGQKYDLILEKYNREVWKLSDDKGYIPSINILRIDAGDYKLFTELIPEDVRLFYGTYKLYVEIKTQNEDKTSNKIDIKID